MTPPAASEHCPACFADAPGSARFCPECGSRLSYAAPDESRQVVTLLFADVVSSTALGEQLDPEALRTAMGRYFEIAREAAERHGGTVEKFVGDAVLAVFGLPRVHEDDALRAVRAARDLRAGIAELDAELQRKMGISFAIRTGVNTGAVVAGGARAGGAFATGDAVNIAARLEQAAGPGEILLGDSTWRMVCDAVVAEPVASLRAKGKAEPLAVHRLLDVCDTTREAQVGVGLLVGRTVELARLEEALAACQAGQRSGLVTVIGEPGAGKSRLLAEFQERFGGEVRVARGRCPSYGDGITYWPIVHVLRDLTGLRGDEEPIAIAAALDRVLVGAEDGADVAGALLPLLGGGGTPSEAETVAWAVGRALEHVAADRGLVVAIDDLHWAEPTLLDLLDGLSVELTDRPVLVIGTARPELAERRPTWPETAKNHDVVELAALTAAEVRARLADLLGGEPAADVVELVVERSGGNALFVGEIAAHLSETGAHGAAEELPPTVGVLLTARLHRLPDAERRLLERVSVVGLEFTRSDALALGDADDGLLRSLVDRGLLHSVAADPETWAFWHILGRDAAYDLLPKARRASLHERFASHVGAGTDGGSERLAFIAHHLATAASCRRDLAPGDAETVALVDRAVVALRAAADDARERDDLGAAIRLLRRALDLPPAALAVRRDLLAVLMNCLLDEDRPAELSPAYDELEAATSGDPDVTDLELSHLRCQRLMGRLLDAPADLMVQLDPAGADLTSKARACGDTVRLGAGLRARAQGLLLQWSYGQIYELYEPLATSGDVHAERFADVTKATAIMEGPFSLRLLEEHVARISVDSAPSPRHRYRLEVMRLAAVAAVQGADRDAGALAELRALSQHPYAAETFNAVHFGYGAVLAGDVDGAITVLGGLCEWFLERDDPWAWAYISLWRSAHRLGRGDEPDAIEVEVNEAYRYIEDVMEVTSTYAWICRALIAAARGDEAAKQHLEIALRLVDTTEATLLRAQVRDWGAQVAAAAGDTATERRLLEEALDLYRLKELGAQTRWTERRLATL